MHMTKVEADNIRNIVHVPVPIKIFISFPPNHMCSALCLVIFEPDVRMAFLHAVRALLLLRIDSFLRSSTFITYMANMNIRVTSVIQIF